MKTTTGAVMKKLEKVIDPELHISIVDMGLIYKVEKVGEKIRILMTLTTIGCPLFSIIESDIKKRVIELGVAEKDIHIEITFDPPWSIERMSPRGKAMLGI